MCVGLKQSNESAAFENAGNGKKNTTTWHLLQTIDGQRSLEGTFELVHPLESVRRLFMPHIAVSLYPGRDEETKRDIAEKLEQFYVETFGTDKEAVSVSIVEIPGEEFSETIQQRYRPEELYISSRAVSNDE